MSRDAAGEQRELKRLAIQIVAQLPAEERRALAVLVYAQELVTGFMQERPAQPKLQVVSGS